MRVLVTGGVRSGKSRHAEELLRPEGSVTYVALGPVHDDADWAARIAAHRARRPATWRTLETGDLAAALRTPGPVLADCLGTWLTRVVDEAGLWDADQDAVSAHVDRRVDEAVAALADRAADPVVLVTNEVGLGVVPEHRSGRLFRDLLGGVNQRLGAACDEVHLVVAGRVLRL
ncbi:bifunctional adenosylcobinamide kinase/adenosylcobinamide-phosphate guanylyltransferase [Nocardioides sp.]|uniref:bifunctional adenosylcobinamide kinase/adenosylcobinamide-phosphate guanylyltransferase n=1 Tax=Nocardioides sp. TaxID=35761 RepID=UPI002ED93486